MPGSGCEVLAIADSEALPEATHEVIWANTPWPGHRTKVGDLQIDVGSGDPLAVPAQRISIDGVSLLAVRPETMFGWKSGEARKSRLNSRT